MPTTKQIKAAKLFVENLGNPDTKTLAEVLRAAGYSEVQARNPQQITSTKTWQSLIEEYLPDDMLAQAHQSLIVSQKLDHMVFPLGPKGEDEPNLSGSKPNAENSIEKSGVKVERTTLTDEEIKDMLAEVNCTVRRIVHGETGRHVYFWSPDTASRSKAVELAYKIKGYITNKVEVKRTDPRKEIIDQYLGADDAGKTQEASD